MCTCGIDIATQQATPAMQSSATSAAGGRPNGCADARPRFLPRQPVSWQLAAHGGRRRMQQRERQHGRDAEHAHADDRSARQPNASNEALQIGGQIAPPR